MAPCHVVGGGGEFAISVNSPSMRRSASNNKTYRDANKRPTDEVGEIVEIEVSPTEGNECGPRKYHS